MRLVPCTVWVCLWAVACGDGADSPAAGGSGGAGGDAGAAGAGSGGASGAGGAGVGGAGGGGSAGTAADAAQPTATPYCAGWENRSNAASCLSAADCAEGQSCIFDFTPLQCPPTGAACPQGCSDDAYCATQGVCHHPFTFDSGRCGCGTGGGTCGPPCVDASSCATGYGCDPGGHCVPLECSEGFACAAGLDCEPEATDADENGCRVLRCHEAGAPACGDNLDCDPAASVGSGCIRRTCDGAADCDCGACAPNGTVRICAFAIGYCGDPEPWF